MRKVIPQLAVWIIKIWFSTCRITIHGQAERDKLDALSQPIIGVIWHYCIIGIFYIMRKEPLVALVSASNDGDYIAELVKKLGYITVRGSRNTGGTRALKGLLRHLRDGKNLAIVADGSQGPPHIAQAGAILLASKTGAPILPMLWSVSRYFTVNSWDRTVLPYPFAKIDFFYGKALMVPKGLDSEGIESYRLKLEERLKLLNEKAWGLHGKKIH